MASNGHLAFALVARSAVMSASATCDLELKAVCGRDKAKGSVDGDSPKYEQPHNRSDRRILEQCLAAVVPAVTDLYS